ncbi:Alanine racemase, biosynthetic [Alcanivorax sp. ALC70]|nr:Alanine racemase, biosynthetic [Alcanivorax sp. ALC70]
MNGQRTRLAGRVSMDMITVDLDGIDARVGDEVELWGDVVSVDEVAAACGTISYELFCQVTARPARVITES